MASLTAILRRHRLAAIDTCVWIYHLQSHARLGPPAARVLEAVETGRLNAVVSELVLLELTVGPLRLGRQDVADEYEILLVSFPNLRLAPVDRAVLLRAARLRAEYDLRTPDAIVIATALEAGASLVITNDRTWKRVPGAEILCLNDVL